MTGSMLFYVGYVWFTMAVITFVVFFIIHYNKEWNFETFIYATLMSMVWPVTWVLFFFIALHTYATDKRFRKQRGR